MSESTRATGYANSREHLLDELARIDLLLRRHLEAWWTGDDHRPNEVPGLYISDEEVDRLLLTPAAAVKQVGSSHSRSGSTTQNDNGEALARIEAVTEAVRKQAAQSVDAGIELGLITLARAFQLTPLEVDAFLLALAPDLDPKYERIYGYLLDDMTKARPTVDLALRILTHGEADRLRARRLFTRRSRLRGAGLIKIVEGPTTPSSVIRVENRIVAFLLGNNAVADEIEPFVTLVDPDETSPTLFIEDDRRDRIAALTEQCSRRNTDPPVKPDIEQLRTRDGSTGTGFWHNGDPPERPLVVGMFGPDERTASAAVEAIYHPADASIVRMDAGKLASVDLNETIGLVSREARLQGGPIHVTSVDALEPTTATTVNTSEADPVVQPPADRLERVIAAFDRFPGDVFLSGDATIGADIQPQLGRHQFLAIPFPRPNSTQRQAIWESIESLPDAADPSRLASTYRLTYGEIEDAVTTARALADGPLTTEAVQQACRLQSRNQLTELAQEIEPTYTWDEIVLPTDTLDHLREIAGAIRHRGTVFEKWGFASRFSLGNGINVLFTGKSGTGKTMAAEVIANDVGLPLYKIDLSNVMSKYIGETEKNLRRVFDTAEQSNAILFFDEADALFGKRTEISDAHDRYANVEVDYLLQRMEEHDGCVILASNLKENIDEAFRRRINAAVSFPVPDEDARREIWRVIFPTETPTESLDFDFLATFELSGGFIKNVALTASFLAAAEDDIVAMSHVVRALHRELQKAGKLYDIDSFGPYRGEFE